MKSGMSGNDHLGLGMGNGQAYFQHFWIGNGYEKSISFTFGTGNWNKKSDSHLLGLGIRIINRVPDPTWEGIFKRASGKSWEHEV